MFPRRSISAAPDIANGRLQIADRLAAGHRAGEVVVLNKKTGRYYKLDDISADLWPLLQQPVSLAEMLPTLSALYEMPSSALVDDITNLLQRLVEYGIVEIQR